MVVLALHAGLLWWLSAAKLVTPPQPPVATVTVSLVAPPAPEPGPAPAVVAPPPQPEPLPPPVVEQTPTPPPEVVEPPKLKPKPLLERKPKPGKPAETVYPVEPQPTPVASAPVPAVTPSAPATPKPAASGAPKPVATAAPAEPTPPTFAADYLHNPKPVYPRRARQAGEQGQVRLRVKVNADGTVEQVLLAASSGYDRLDESAIDAVKRWRFVPARLGDKPVSAWVIVPVNFRLKE